MAFLFSYIVLVTLTVGAESLAETTTEGPPIAVGRCLKCHTSTVSAEHYFSSVHRNVSCTACHVQDPSHRSGQGCVAPFKTTTCVTCHERESREHKTSVHNSVRLPVSCSQCHSAIHALPGKKGDKIKSVSTCLECHSRQKSYLESNHYKGLVDKKNDSASCVDCHSAHAVSAVLGDSSSARVQHTESCLNCHGDGEMMQRNKITTVAATTYFNSFHGKNVKLGYPEKVAGCADCHSAHLILDSKNARSSIHQANRQKTCAQCHDQATPSFTEFIAHAEDSDKDRYPALYWTKIAMTTLLGTTFFFFWVHSFLWAIRSYIERHRHAVRQAFPRSGDSSQTVGVSSRKTIYRRFRLRHILLHIAVIVSFLGLSLTGLPLKFSDAWWSKALVDALGGTEQTRLIHHVCALITFGYFVVAVGMSIHFLFLNKKQPGGFIDRLFGPDSLFPNKRDLSDLRAMFLWFLFKGPKPTFERWAYWEKFDFLAVFWGMLAIGLSGVMLWFPEFFGALLPGWMFNIATIIHSDEALLATGFIFTVHFFNTHFRPDKFPMDFVIFNGQIPEHEFIEERGAQWERLKQEGRLDELVARRHSSAIWDFTMRIFGFVAVLVGLLLAVAMIAAI